MPIPTRAYDRSLNAEIERLLYQVDVVCQDAEGLLNGLDQQQVNWSPAPGSWSIAQNLQHLNLTNKFFLANLEKVVAYGRAAGRLAGGPYSYSLLSRWMLKIVQPPAKTKFKAPKSFQPQQEIGLEALHATWTQSHDTLRELIQASNGLDLVGIKVASPVTSLLKYNLGMAFWIITAHDRRHLAQAREVRNHSAFPRAVS
ncbi:MAG: DinB family protein [Acidimicrobiia bacterium]|nr:DinB family protein [Acidimicrobiia bacterium]